MANKTKEKIMKSEEEHAKMYGAKPKIIFEWGRGDNAPRWRIVSKYFHEEKLYSHVLEVQIPDALGVQSWREVSYDSSKALADALMMLADEIARGYITLVHGFIGAQKHAKNQRKKDR